MVDHGPPSSSSFNYQPYPAEYQRNHPPPGFHNGPGPYSSSSRSSYPPPFPPQPPINYRPFPPPGSPPPPLNQNSNVGRNKYPQPLPPQSNPSTNFNFPPPPPPPPPHHHNFGPQARMGDGGLPPPPPKRATAEKKQAIAANKPSGDPPVMRVANVPDNTTDEDIRLLFQRFGGIVKIQMWKSTRLKNTNAYVTMKDHPQVNKILADFNRNVRMKEGIWSRFYEKGYKCSVNVPTGNEWFKYEAPTTIEWSTPSLPIDGPSRDVPSSSSTADAAPLGYDEDSNPLPSSSSSSTLLPPKPDDDGSVDGSVRPPAPASTTEPDPDKKDGDEDEAQEPRRSRSRKRRGSWTDDPSLPPAARDRGDKGDEPPSRSRSPGSHSRPRSEADAVGGGDVGAAGSSSSALAAGGDGQASVPGDHTATKKEAAPYRVADCWVPSPSPPPNGSSRSYGRNGRSISPATSDRNRSGRVVSGRDSWNGPGGIPPSSSSRQPQTNQSSPPTSLGGPSNYERTPVPSVASSSGGLISPRSLNRQHQRNPSNQSLPRLGPTISTSSSFSSLLSHPATAPYPHPPPPFLPAPNTDSDLLQRLGELESLLTASRDQSSQIYHHLLSTESSLLTLANTVLTAQQSQKKAERERDEALSWRNEVERRMGTVLGVLEEVGGRSLREGVERGLEEGRKGEREVEGELNALLGMDVDEPEGMKRGGRIGWDVVENLVKQGREQEELVERESRRR